jgi:hypothetical protein
MEAHSVSVSVKPARVSADSVATKAPRVPDSREKVIAFSVGGYLRFDAKVVWTTASGLRDLAAASSPSSRADRRLDALNIKGQVRQAARCVIESLCSGGLRADRIGNSGPEEVFLYFFGERVLSGGSHSRYVCVVVGEDDTVLASFVDRETEVSSDLEVGFEDLDSIAAQICDFVGARGTSAVGG